MSKLDALPYQPRRLLCKKEAAVYLSVSANTFEQLIRAQRMPEPVRLGQKRIAWDLRELDKAIDRLSNVTASPISDSSKPKSIVL